MNARKNGEKGIIRLFITVMLLVCVSICSHLKTDAAGYEIANNGIGGIYIDINSAPYNENWSYGDPYGPGGCTWFVGSRVKQLTGKGRNATQTGSTWYNSYGRSLGFSTGQEIKAPSVVCWQGHVAILEKLDGNTAYLSEGGISNNGSPGRYKNWGSWQSLQPNNRFCVIHAIEKNEIISWCGTRSDFIGFVYLGGSAVPDTQPPVISNVKVFDITADGYSVSCTVADNVGVAKVRFPSWNADIHMGEQAEWLEGSISGNTASVRVNIGSLKSGAREGHYMTHIYAYDAAGNTGSLNINNGRPLFIDRTPPVISNVTVSDITADGYTVSCTVIDNVGVAKVRFPSWNADIHMGEQAEWLEGSISGNTASVRINIGSLKSGAREGHYMTHIYAYDAAGNTGSSNINNGHPLFIDRTPPLITDVYAEKVGKDGYWVYCKVTDNLENNIDRVQFPTWTLYNDQDDLIVDWKNSSAVRGEKYGDCNYRFFVNINEHNRELGPYRTHVFALDKYGNPGEYGGLEDIEFTVEDPIMPDNPSNPDNPDNPGDPDNPKPPVTPIYCTVNFQKNGGTKLSQSKVTVQNAQMIGTLPKVQRKGYTLKGWYTAKSGGTKISASTRILKSQTLYAQWSKVRKPGKVTSLSVQKVKKGKVRITYKKVNGAAGYEIAYSSNSRFSKYATYKVNVKPTKRTLSGLWKNQVYYVRVRAYKLDSAGNKVYGSYSAKKKVRV